MNQLVFRAYDPNSGDFVYGEWMNDGDEIQEFWKKVCSSHLEVDQFTGRVDVLGKRIFSGDFLYNPTKGLLQEVIYDESSSQFIVLDVHAQNGKDRLGTRRVPYPCQIVGNASQHPELRSENEWNRFKLREQLN